MLVQYATLKLKHTSAITLCFSGRDFFVCFFLHLLHLKIIDKLSQDNPGIDSCSILKPKMGVK